MGASRRKAAIKLKRARGDSASQSRPRAPGAIAVSDVNEKRIVLSVLALLTVIVWGLFALDRGMWQDDTLQLALANLGKGFLARCCSAPTSPTRVFADLPFAVALLTRIPVASLQLIYGLVWLASGILIYAIVRLLFPGESLLAYFAGALTVCATSDFLTDSLASLHYQVATAAYFASLYCLLHAWRSRKILWLLPTAALLSFSIWTVDAAFTVVVLTPLILWAWDDFRASRRLFLVTAFWYAVFAPYAFVFLKFLRDPHSYAATALVPMAFGARIGRIWSLFALNFNPWSWGPARKNWFEAQPSLIPPGLAIALSMGGTIAFLFAGRRLRTAREQGELPELNHMARMAIFGLLSLIMALASNAAYAMVQVSEYFYRTQIMSRCWASISIAIAAVAMSRVRGLRKLEFGLPVLFVGLGLYGGLNRQDYYLGYWQRHRNELRSIVEAVPNLNESARLVLFVPAHRPYLATQVSYLAQSWTALLYDDPSFFDRTFLWESGKVECALESDRLTCRERVGEPVFSAPIETTVVLHYCASLNRFDPVDETGLARLLGDENAIGYELSGQIRREPTELGRELLYPPGGIARFLPGLAGNRETPDSRQPGAPSSCLDSRPVGNVDRVAGRKPTTQVAEIPRGPWEVVGWAADSPQAGGAVDSVVLTLDEAPIGTAVLELPRSDVAASFRSSRFLTTGWRVRVNRMPIIDSNAHRLSATIHAIGGAARKLDAGLIRVRQS